MHLFGESFIGRSIVHTSTHGRCLQPRSQASMETLRSKRCRAMGLERVTVGDLQELLKVVEQRKGSEGQLYVLFCGSIQPETGESWCSDCVKAEPVIAKVLGEVTSGVFIRCSVGERAAWKDPENVFRKHPKLQLTGVPTLMRWGTAQRLGPDDCAKEDLVRLLFEED